MIYTDGAGGTPLGRNGRVLLVLWSVLLAGGFALAWRLEPDPRGFGTHQRLGLPPCTLRYFAGIPCPSCGMTTSFSYLMKGDVQLAVHANAAGVLLAVLCAVQIPWCLITAARGRYFVLENPTQVLLWCLLAVIAVSLINWIIQLVR